MKTCCSCKTNKTILDFHKNSGHKDGHSDKCKLCTAIYDKKRRLEKNNEIKLKKKIAHQIPINKKRDNLRSKRWRKEHREHSKKYFKKRWEVDGKKLIQIKIEKRRNNIHLKLRHNVSSLITQRLKSRLLTKNGKSTFSFLPYTINELMAHLESKFKPGMNWQNYGKWHIDHIIPDCNFHYTSVEDQEFQKCWSLENLQPLWAEENLSKNKY